MASIFQQQKDDKGIDQENWFTAKFMTAMEMGPFSVLRTLLQNQS